MKLGQMAQYLGGSLDGISAEAVVSSVHIDSRSVAPGGLFFALSGERADGHDFLADVASRGAIAAVVSRPGITAGLPLIRVTDTRVAMGRMAQAHLARLPVSVVGITGSAGKSSVKEMLAHALAAQLRVAKNEGNLNTEIGLPLSVMEITAQHQVAVLEMSMRGAGQIAWLCEIAAPTHGLITNIGVSHIEILGSRRAIAEAKAELLDALPVYGTAILPADDPFLSLLVQRVRCARITFGWSETADAQAVRASVESDGRTVGVVNCLGQTVEFALPVPGRHQVLNAAAALAGAAALGIDARDAADQLASVRLPGMRMEILQGDGFEVILDAYNANPQSMEAGLQTLIEMGGTRRTIAVLGGMAELGEHSTDAHVGVGEMVARLRPSVLVTVGEAARAIGDSAVRFGYPNECVAATEDLESAGDWLIPRLMRGDLLLIKGSRVLEMERLATDLLGGETERRRGV